MRAHPESVRDRLELLGLLVNASALPPEPRLMHEGPVRRVHQSDDPVVNMRRQLARKMRDLVFVAEYRKRGRRRYRLRQARPRAIHINPNIPVSLFAGIMPHKDPASACAAASCAASASIRIIVRTASLIVVAAS